MHHFIISPFDNFIISPSDPPGVHRVRRRDPGAAAGRGGGRDGQDRRRLGQVRATAEKCVRAFIELKLQPEYFP